MSYLEFALRYLHTSRFKYLFSILLLVCVVLNYTFNFSTRLGEIPTSQNYLDFTFTLSSIAIVLIFIYLLVSYKKWFRYITAFLLSLSLLQYSLTPFYGITSISHQVIATLTLVLWIYFLKNLYHTYLLNGLEKTLLVGSLLFYSVFDHFLYSEPEVIVFLIALSIFINEPKPSSTKALRAFKYLILGFFSLNGVVGIFQFLTGHSVGLKYLGEQFLDQQHIGIARQTLNGVKFLRAYGITNHPNVLGFFGTTGFFIAQNTKISSMWPRLRGLLGICSVILVIISFSRASWLILLAMQCYAFIRRTDRSQGKNRSIKYILILFSIGLVFLSIQKFFNTDIIYRIEDYKQYLEAIEVMDWRQLLFGIGLGRYPFFLRTNFDWALWEYQPMHNTLLGVLLELGFLPSILLCLWSIFKSLPSYPKLSDSSQPIVLMTTYFNSQSMLRQNEIDYCLKHNLNNKLIHQIVIIGDSLPEFAQNNSKIVHIYNDKVPKYVDFLEEANTNYLNSTIIIANSDIHFDDSLASLKNFSLKNSLLALTRIEEDGELSKEGKLDSSGNFYSHSQDAWIFASPLPAFNANFSLGKVGCENRFLAEAYFAGLKILDPARSIKAYHKHNSQVRTWKSEESYHGFKAFPVIGEYSKVQIIWM